MQQESDTTGFPDFDREVPADGYAWWYVDAVSDDGKHALTIITFIGSVFSPYYAWARRKSETDPLDHCAINVALYGQGPNRWAMTERGRTAVNRCTDRLAIGPSAIRWDGESVIIEIDEIATPFPRRVRGRVRIWPSALGTQAFSLDGSGRHLWRPLAPCSRVEVDLKQPKLKWQGHAYLDSNTGSRPLEDDFLHWDWSRSTEEGSTSILYEGIRRNGEAFDLAIKVNASGDIERFDPPPAAQLATTRWWRIKRATRAEQGCSRVVSTLEDTPFYSRSLLEVEKGDRLLPTIHESLSMPRFTSKWVQCLLPFRMPRTGN
jgi:carotenoid 1,2-hydratase